MKKRIIKYLLIAAISFTLGAVTVSKLSQHVDEAGGAYAFSPDGLWMAEISDGYSSTHKRNYAVIRLWDLDKYSSLRGDGIRTYFGKSPTLEMKFPQDFHARDSDCEVEWESDSGAFSIKYARLSDSTNSEASSTRRFQYGLEKETFTLEIIDTESFE